MAETPYMNLELPIPGETTGPSYAEEINNNFTKIDGHTHASGSGNPVNPGGLDINSDLQINNHNLTEVRSVNFYAQLSTLALAADIRCIYAVLGDLYYNNSSGVAVQITDGSSVAGATGTIANLVSPASATYVSLSTKIVFESDANTAASLDCRNLILRNAAASSKGLTLQPPAAMGADFDLILPSLPVSEKIMTLDASGNMGASYTVDSQTIVISTDVIQIPSSVDLPGSGVKVNSKRVVTANTNAAANLEIIRFVSDGAGNLSSGEGATIAVVTPGAYPVTFTTPFADVPAINVTVVNTLPRSVTLDSVSASGCTVFIWSGVALSAQSFHFTAIGQRA